MKKLLRLMISDILDWPRDFFVNWLAAAALTPRLFRWLILRIYGVRVATRNILPGAVFKSPRAFIGRGTFINRGCFFENVAPIEIGQRCYIAMEVLFCTATHEFGGPHQRAGQAIARPIKVGDGCWIGARAVILPGVTISEGCVIAAGAVVTKDCNPNGLYAGVPARRVKDLDHQPLLAGPDFELA